MTHFFLFSSASRTRYSDDALNVLALPEGALYLFRYSLDDLVDGALHKGAGSDKDYKKHLATYADSSATIVFVDQTDTTPPTVNRFPPIRQAIVKRFEASGSTLYVYFELREYIGWRQAQATQWDQTIKGVDEAYRPPTKYISSDRIVLNVDADASPSLAWESIVNELCAVAFFKQAIFYRMAECSRIAQDNWLQRHNFRYTPRSATREPVALNEVVYDSSGLVLTSGQIYTVILDFYRPRSAPSSSGSVSLPPIPPGIKIVPTVNENFFAFVPAAIPVTFRYDRRMIELIPKVTNQDSFTNLHIVMRHDIPPQTGSEFSAPNINIMLRLNYDKRRVWTWLAVIFVGQLLTKIDVFKKFPDTPVNGPAIALIVGTLLTLLGIYQLLGKIPSAFG